LGLMACTLAFGGWAWRLDRVVYDLGLALWHRPQPPGITIVAIDDASIDAIGRWPWRRAVHASMVERLAQTQPKAMTLDLVLSEADPDPSQDAVLARALARSAARGVPVVVPVAWEATQEAPLVVTKPVSELSVHVRQGASEAPVDADGVLRHAFLTAGPARTPYPHVAWAMMQAAGEALHPRLRTESSATADAITAGYASPGAGPGFAVAPRRAGATQRDWLREDRFLIRYAGGPGTVDWVSFVDVLSGSVPASRFAGRYVLVGMTAQGLGDTLATPVNGSHRAMSGVEVLANVLYTLRSGDTIETVSDTSVAAVSTALLVALVVSFGLFGPRRALPTAVVAVPLAVVVSLWVLGAGRWFSPVAFALPAVLAYPLWSWRRLERAVTGLDQEIARLAAEPLVAATVLEGVPSGRAMPGPANPADRPAAVGFEAGGDAIAARLQTLQRAGTVVRQARRFLSDALTALPTAMLVADEHSRVLLANPKAAALFEVEAAEELQGLDLARLLTEFSTQAPFDWPAAVAALTPAGAGVAVEGTLGRRGAARPGVVSAAGAAADYVVHLAAVDLQGQRRLIVTIADIEPVKQAQREREEALAFVSHDLRSPASSIVLLADLNLKQQPTSAPEALLLEVRRLAVRTLALSEEFVRAAQVQTLALQLAPVGLQELLDDALADLRAQAQAVAVDLRTELHTDPAWAGPSLPPAPPAPPAPPVAVLDRALISRAIANLVSNAIKHSPRHANVVVSARLHAGRLVVGVRDRGPGLSAEQLSQLARGDRGAVVRDVRGIGLGLLFVQRVARRHGGSLRAPPPADGAGALFELDIPAAAVAAPPLARL
jgi:CHASE2 domain-containing sensor protein/nitrogen-specific signal transduction histidine kinase